MLSSGLTVFLRGVLLVACLLAAACQTAPPVQEMSDARQAISVAVEAGAEQHAAAALRAANAHLDSAERYLSTRNYAIARREAIEAKTKALEALERSAAFQEAED